MRWGVLMQYQQVRSGSGTNMLHFSDFDKITQTLWTLSQNFTWCCNLNVFYCCSFSENFQSGHLRSLVQFFRTFVVSDRINESLGSSVQWNWFEVRSVFILLTVGGLHFLSFTVSDLCLSCSPHSLQTLSFLTLWTCPDLLSTQTPLQGKGNYTESERTCMC